MGRFKLPEELDFIRAGRLPQKYSRERMNGKVCVLTGATSGVGYEAANTLVGAGATLAIMVRDKQKAEELSKELKEKYNTEAQYFIADFSDLKQVRQATEAILAEYPKIDVLINNAGVHMTTRQLTNDGHEVAFCVNHLAAFLITSLLLKRLVESAPSRIIQVNSEGHRFNGLDIDDLTWAKRRYKGIKGYGASKTAQLMTVWELNDLLDGKGVTINAMHPGAVKSNIGTNNGLLYNLYSKYIVQPLLKDPKISGEAIYYHASSPEMEGVSGKFYNLTNEEIPAKHAVDRELGKQIFQISKELTQLDKEDIYEI
ncbi:SDR family NAD(P)-dependent oxidoreductase [Prolixibacteraceae bacterium Z1-6]|uniref:SDR family NAD(P)-dependent oxidoreductase n=1 Tax=Draconibacterium aestuarii TaxID=2998507 RepID=A0A9X3FIH5_9BACT|nr:SDR family NAD(P)-dependent oxidoreductase [Prolixibacteraceae bacterium Z1-6]